MAPIGKTLALTIALSAGILAIACSKSPSDSAATGPAAQGGGGSPAATGEPRKQNACALFDREGVEKIVGQKLTMLHNIEDTDQTACELAPEGTSQTLVIVKVYWRGGREMARTEQAAMSMARQLLNEPRVDIEKLTGSGSVKGLADAAYYSDVMPSWVLKDDVFIQFLTPLLTADQSKQVFMLVATQALPRLKAVS